MMKNKTKIPQVITLTTRFGPITYTQDDVYTFHTSLTGFDQYKRFIKTRHFPILTNPSLGLLQSIEDPDLCFILFYPETPEEISQLIYEKVNSLRKNLPQENRHIQLQDIDLAFLVMIEKDEKEHIQVSLVESGPLVFDTDQKVAWQIIN